MLWDFAEAVKDSFCPQVVGGGCGGREGRKDLTFTEALPCARPSA